MPRIIEDDLGDANDFDNSQFDALMLLDKPMPEDEAMLA